MDLLDWAENERPEHDLTTPTGKRDEALERVDANARPDWRECARMARDAVMAEVGRGGQFTSEDIWDRIERDYPEAETHEPRAMGPVMMEVSRAGLVERIGYVPHKRITCNAGPMAVWRVK